MKYIDFKSKMRRFPVITGTLLSHLDEDERIFRNQLSRWQNQKLLVKLRKGLYLLNREDRAVQPSVMNAALTFSSQNRKKPFSIFCI